MNKSNEETMKREKLLCLKNISPVDGRYKHVCSEISEYFSEFALIKNRIIVEIKWLLFLNDKELFFSKRSSDAIKILETFKDVNDEDVLKVKKIEEVTNHDVKAVEYFIKEKIKETGVTELLDIAEFVHFLCTSEDINNISYAISIQLSLQSILIPKIKEIMNELKKFAITYANEALLSRTHGQPASTTTFGKEMGNFFYRLKNHLDVLEKIKIKGKWNGAVGNFNAHVIANSQVDWIDLMKEYIQNYFNLEFAIYCTQIQDHDYICELSDALARINSTLIDLCVDLWLYISNDLLKLKVVKSEVGSSTMPHKVNPIYFENAEGNFHVSNALFKMFSSKLSISRLQRDLSDSTILRNLGSAFSYSFIAYDSILKGFSKIEVDTLSLKKELNEHWSILAEPIQIILKKCNVKNAYEELKEFTRGTNINQMLITNFIKEKCMHLSEQEFKQLINLTPHNYVGYAEKLAEQLEEYVEK